MTITKADTSLGRPISGEVRATSTTIYEQGTPAEFLAALDAVLAVEGVESVVWDQYVPYFNDGEACEFGWGEIRVTLSAEFAGEEEEDFEGDYGTGRTAWELHSYGDLAGKRPGDGSYQIYGTPGYAAERAWSNVYYSEANQINEVNGHDTTAIKEALDALNLNRFEDIIRANFGDHASVTATREGFAVEDYEHD